MRRTRLALLLFSWLFVGFAALTAAQPRDDLATLVDGQARKQPKKTPPPRDMPRWDTIKTAELPALVQTPDSSLALFAVGTKGAVTMGPASTFTFESGQFDPKTGLLSGQLNLEIEFGKFWFWFTHPIPAQSFPAMTGPSRGEVVIKNPARRPVRLAGTVVYMSAERNGETHLVVFEGEAVIETGENPEGQQPVTVSAGHWASFRPGQAKIEVLNLASEVGGPPGPGAPEIPGPALLDLASPRLDLPKSIHP